MIGQKTFSIDWKDFVRGMGSAQNTYDAGFGVGGTAGKSIVNLLANPGILHAPGAVTDKSDNLVGEMLGSCEDPTGNASRLFLARNTSNEDGTFYYSDSTGALTLKRTDSTNNYVFGKSDIIGYKGEVYATSVGAITRWVPDSVFNVAFFAFSDASAPHPCLVYEDNAFYGDGNELLRQTSAGGAPSVILTLPSNQVIVSLGIDPGSGSILISTVSQYNNSATINTQPMVLYYDGSSEDAYKFVLVDEMITAFYNVGGYIYITYGQNLGYWTGSGIQFLRKLDLSYDNTVLAYKQHLTNINQTLYVIEKTRILAHGEIVGGKSKVFYYALKNNSGDSGNYSHIANIGQGRLGLGFATAKFFTFDINSVAAVTTGGGLWYSNKVDFDRPVTFNQAIIDFASAIPATSGNVLTLALIPDTGESNIVTLGTVNTATSGLLSWTFPYPTIKTRSIQFRATLASSNPADVVGIERITVFYNPQE